MVKNAAIAKYARHLIGLISLRMGVRNNSADKSYNAYVSAIDQECRESKYGH
jgi:hypothetical protein